MGVVIALAGVTLFLWRDQVAPHMHFLLPIPPIGVAAYVFVYNLFSKYHGQLPGSLAETLSEILIATVLSACAYFAFIVLIIVFVKLTKAL